MRQLGLSLVELMVAIAIASFIALTAMSYYAAMFSASNAVRNTAFAQSHFNTLANTLVAEIRRSGYRGSPTEVAAYVATTGNSSGKPIVGSYPAVETTGDCVLVAYARDYNCALGDEDDFTECSSGAGARALLHYRTGFRVRSGVMEAISVVHPNQYISPPTLDSSCTATGITSAWKPINEKTRIRFDVFSVIEHASVIYDGDYGCVLGTPDTRCSSSVYSDCGDSISCRIKRVYKIELCANLADSGYRCDNTTVERMDVNQFHTELFVTPRNDVLIAKEYSS